MAFLGHSGRRAGSSPYVRAAKSDSGVTEVQTVHPSRCLPYHDETATETTCHNRKSGIWPTIC